MQAVGLGADLEHIECSFASRRFFAGQPEQVQLTIGHCKVAVLANVGLLSTLDAEDPSAFCTGYMHPESGTE